jgi:site-specific DNA-methyltransferase (adenine-specific)
MHTLHNGDALEWMKTLPAASVDCVFVDLPYFGVVADDWDNQWKDRNEYLDWVVSLAHEWKRITKSNSSIFVFCDEKMEAYIQVRLDEIFLLLNKIVWFKRNNLPQKNAHLLRTFAPMTERALFYATSSDELRIFPFEPLKNYLVSVMEKSGHTMSSIDKEWQSKRKSKGQMAGHWFGNAQWQFPTESHFEFLVSCGLQFDKTYLDLLAEYETLRRPFNADNKTWDVLEFPIIGGDDNTDHPTTKPSSLVRRILSVITNPGQVVLDCCMGSGRFGAVAIELGRHFLGCEKKAEYFAIAEGLISQAVLSPSFYTLPNNRLQPTAFGVGTQAEFPLLGSSQADESSATHGGG